MKEFDVVALGELLVDFVEQGLSNDNHPLFEASPGGAPCNVLALLSHLNKKTAFIGKVGDDFFGTLCKDALIKEGINIDNLVIDNQVPTTLAIVHNDINGERSFAFYRHPGADMMLKEEEFNEAILSKTKIFHFGTLSMSDENIKKVTINALSKAKSNGALISFDPNLRKMLWDDLTNAKSSMWYGISQANIIKISDDELAFLTDSSDIDEGIKMIKKQCNPQLIVVSKGANGSKAFYQDKIIDQQAFLNPHTIDTTGAGDCFMGCILNYVLEHGLNNLSDTDLKDMLSFASSAASLITTHKGALSVMPYQEEIVNYLNKQNND